MGAVFGAILLVVTLVLGGGELLWGRCRGILFGVAEGGEEEFDDVEEVDVVDEPELLESESVSDEEDDDGEEGGAAGRFRDGGFGLISSVTGGSC